MPVRWHSSNMLAPSPFHETRLPWTLAECDLFTECWYLFLPNAPLYRVLHTLFAWVPFMRHSVYITLYRMPNERHKVKCLTLGKQPDCRICISNDPCSTPTKKTLFRICNQQYRLSFHQEKWLCMLVEYSTCIQYTSSIQWIMGQ